MSTFPPSASSLKKLHPHLADKVIQEAPHPHLESHLLNPNTPLKLSRSSSLLSSVHPHAELLCKSIFWQPRTEGASLPDCLRQGSPPQQAVFSSPCSQTLLPYTSCKCPVELQATGPNARIHTEMMCKRGPGPSLMFSKSRLESNASASSWGPPSATGTHQAQHPKAVGFVLFFKASFALFLIYSKVTGNVFLLLQSPEPAHGPHTEDHPAEQS